MLTPDAPTSRTRVHRPARMALLALAFLALPGAPGGAFAQSEAMSEMLARLDALSARAALSDAEILSRFNTIAGRYLDRRHMAMRALGTHARTLTTEERAAYLAAYDRHSALAFLRAMRQYGAAQSTLRKLRQTPAGGLVAVTTITTGARQSDVILHLCAHDRDRVCDTAVDGAFVSRHESRLFAAVLARGGLPLLIAELRRGALVRQ